MLIWIFIFLGIFTKFNNYTSQNGTGSRECIRGKKRGKGGQDERHIQIGIKTLKQAYRQKDEQIIKER